MEQHPHFEAFDPFAEPDPLSKSIQLNLNDFETPQAAPAPRFRGEVVEPPPAARPAAPPTPEPAPRREPERPRERSVERPRPEPARSSLESESLLESDAFVRARRVAEMKFSFVLTAIALTLVNIGLAIVSYLEIQPAGPWWFCWPLGVSVLYLLARFIKVYVLQGLDLRSLKERRLEEMTLREVRRSRLMSS
ncbi:2TM domain-containing protein [bacterium]|nr:2TM domain-containing protein [bacterium]